MVATVIATVQVHSNASPKPKLFIYKSREARRFELILSVYTSKGTSFLFLLLLLPMKATIIRLLKEEEKECLDEKSLRKSVCKLHKEETEDKDERKAAFIAVLNKLVTKGKIVLENDVVRLVKKQTAQDEEQEEVAVAVIAEKKEKKQKKEKKRRNDDDAPEEEEVSTKKGKKSKSSDTKTDESNTSAAAAAAAATTAVTGSTDESVIVKKEYPPIEALTGNNTILLFYAYCTPVMSKGEHINITIIILFIVLLLFYSLSNSESEQNFPPAFLSSPFL